MNPQPGDVWLGGEFIAAPVHILETQDAHIEPQARLHVFDAQDRLAAFETNTRLLGTFHKVPACQLIEEGGPTNVLKNGFPLPQLRFHQL